MASGNQPYMFEP